MAPDDHPCFPSHMLLRPVIPERIDGAFQEVVDDVTYGTVNKRHLDCRARCTAGDIEVMARLAETVPGYMITQSEQDSGASIPEHVHTHLFQLRQTRFPLMARHLFSPVSGTNAKVWVNRQYTYALLVRGEPKLIAEVIAGLRATFALPSNHFFKFDPYWGLSGWYVPRTSSMPANPEIRPADWRFGAFEVMGLFDAKTPKLYESLTTAQACNALREVTVHDASLQHAMESCAAEALKHSLSLESADTCPTPTILSRACPDSRESSILRSAGWRRGAKKW